MLFGITAAFWVGMGITALIVIAGCAVAWLLPPSRKKACNIAEPGAEKTCSSAE